MSDYKIDKQVPMPGDKPWLESCKEKHLCYRCGKAAESDKTRCRSCASLINEKSKQTRYEIKQEIFNHYGRICKCCGQTNINFLSMDHINGGGVLHRKLDPSANNLYIWLKRHNFPAEFRVLCYNCNYSRGFYGYCPHEREKTGYKNIGCWLG